MAQGQKIKWTAQQVKESYLDPGTILYTKRIIPFIRKVTKEELLDDLHRAGLLTKEIRQIIED